MLLLVLLAAMASEQTSLSQQREHVDVTDVRTRRILLNTESASIVSWRIQKSGMNKSPEFQMEISL